MGRPAKSREEWIEARDHLPRPLRREGAIQDALDVFGITSISAATLEHVLRELAFHGFVLSPLRTSMTWHRQDLDAVIEAVRRERAISPTTPQRDAA